MLFAAGRFLCRAGGLFRFGKLLADGSTGFANVLTSVLVFVNQRVDAKAVFHTGQVQGLVRQHGKQLVRVPAGCQLGEVGRYLHHKMILVRAVGSSQPLHICRDTLCLGLDQPGVQCRKMFFEITGPCRFPAALLLPDGRLQKFRVTGLHFIPHELPEIFVRAAVEMLFRANFPHPTFVDYAIGTHRQSGIPDMLEMLLVVQFIQIALQCSIGCAGQLYRIGKNPVVGLLAAEFPCVLQVRGPFLYLVW